MRIAVFLPSLEIGGVEKVMLNLLVGFSTRGHEVEVVLSSLNGHYITNLPRNIKIYNLNANRMSASIIPLARYLYLKKPDVLISGKEYANVVSIIAKFMSQSSVRVIVTVHTTLSKHIIYATTFREKVIIPFMAKRLYPHAQHIVAVSSGVAKDLSKLFRIPPEYIAIINNPVVSSELFSKAAIQISHPWFAKGRPPVIISVGRLTRAKDYGTLIKAFKKVRGEINARLMILGDGEERLSLQRLINKLELESDVCLPGFVDPPYPYLARSSLFVLSSIWEGLSTAIIEALALGIPVVSTDCQSSPREILDNGRYGKLVPVKNVDKLAEAIIESLKTEHDPLQLKIRAHQYSVDSAVEAYLRLISDRDNFRKEN